MLQARNEILVLAPVERVWSVITDVALLPRINPGVIKASGSVAQGTRTCEISGNGRKGTMTERLIEWVPEERTVWTIESDTMGMSKMLRDTRFCFRLEKVEDTRTRVINETWYRPANLAARIMNGFMLRRMMGKTQAQILQNIKLLTEKAVV